MNQSPSKARRAIVMTAIVLKYFVFYRFTPLRVLPLGERMRRACESLGPVFIKLGQILGTRYDLLDKSDCQYLHKLLDDVTPAPHDQIIELFKSDFGKAPTELYKVFPEKPLASASI